jgi:hypothetical protein
MQRKYQVFHKISALVVEDQRQPQGKEENITELKKRKVVLPMFVDSVKQRVSGQVSTLSSVLKFFLERFSFNSGLDRSFLNSGNDVANVKMPDYGTGIKEEADGKYHQEQTQRQYVTPLPSRQVLGGKESRFKDQSAQRTEDFCVEMRQLMQAFVQKATQLEVVRTKGPRATLMAIRSGQWNKAFRAVTLLF